MFDVEIYLLMVPPSDYVSRLTRSGDPEIIETNKSEQLTRQPLADPADLLLHGKVQIFMKSRDHVNLNLLGFLPQLLCKFLFIIRNVTIEELLGELLDFLV